MCRHEQNGSATHRLETGSYVKFLKFIHSISSITDTNLNISSNFCDFRFFRLLIIRFYSIIISILFLRMNSSISLKYSSNIYFAYIFILILCRRDYLVLVWFPHL